jgi:hypothetical protein
MMGDLEEEVVATPFALVAVRTIGPYQVFPEVSQISG